MRIIPASRPRLSAAELHKKLELFHINRDKHPLIVVGIRGYYLRTMGDPATNDRGIYDDAIFIDCPDAMVAFNGNTDPSKYRPGRGTGAGKGMASLKPGVYYAHTFGMHRGKYLALVQTAGPVTVIRDGSPPYEDRGWFGINIHRGGEKGTGSEGCQTIPPAQWQSFINLMQDLAQRYYGAKWKTATVPYVLLEEEL
jgi:lysozyme